MVCILMFEFQTRRFFGRSGPCFYHLLFLPNFAWADGMRHYCRATTAGNEENQAKRKWSSSYRRYLNNHLNKSIMVSIWLYWRDIIILNGETELVKFRLVWFQCYEVKVTCNDSLAATTYLACHTWHTQPSCLKVRKPAHIDMYIMTGDETSYF